MRNTITNRAPKINYDDRSNNLMKFYDYRILIDKPSKQRNLDQLHLQFLSITYHNLNGPIDLKFMDACFLEQIMSSS